MLRIISETKPGRALCILTVAIATLGVTAILAGDLMEIDCDDHCETDCGDCGDCIECSPTVFMSPAVSKGIDSFDLPPTSANNSIPIHSNLIGENDIDHPPRVNC